jgi:hypothetical protein
MASEVDLITDPTEIERIEARWRHVADNVETTSPQEWEAALRDFLRVPGGLLEAVDALQRITREPQDADLVEH